MLRKTVSSIVTALALAAVARAHGSSVNITMDSNRTVRTCEDIRIEFDHRPARRAEDAFKLPAAAPLRVGPAGRVGWGSDTRVPQMTEGQGYPMGPT